MRDIREKTRIVETGMSSVFEEIYPVQKYKEIDEKHVLITYEDDIDVNKVIKACKHCDSDGVDYIHKL
jgi:hypothetical protein